MQKVKLGDIASVITKGTTPLTVGYDFINKGINFIKIEAISENGSFIDKRIAHISEECYKKLSRSQLEENDILFSIAGAIGRVAIVTKNYLPANTNQALAIIRIPSNYINYRYLFYALQSDSVKNQINGYKQGVAQLNLSLKNISDLVIILHEEQKAIAEKLDKVSRLIEKRKQQLSLLDTLVKSKFVEMFGDPEINPHRFKKVTINDVCESIVRGPFGSSLKKEFFVEKGDKSYKVYEQKHAIQKSATIGTYYIDETKFKELSRFECKAGDFLMSCSGTMGEIYQLPENCERGIINQALCKFTLNKKITPVYFLVFMKQTIGKLETKGSGIKNIAAVSYVKTMPVILPPIGLQTQFTAFVERVDNKNQAEPFRSRISKKITNAKIFWGKDE